MKKSYRPAKRVTLQAESTLAKVYMRKNRWSLCWSLELTHALIVNSRARPCLSLVVSPWSSWLGGANQTVYMEKSWPACDLNNETGWPDRGSQLLVSDVNESSNFAWKIGAHKVARVGEWAFSLGGQLFSTQTEVSFLLAVLFYWQYPLSSINSKEVLNGRLDWLRPILHLGSLTDNRFFLVE